MALAGERNVSINTPSMGKAFMLNQPERGKAWWLEVEHQGSEAHVSG